MTTGPRVGASAALAALSGLLLTLAFPPYDLWPLIFVGFIPLVVAQHRVAPPRLSGVAYGLGIGAFFWGYFGPMFAGVVSALAWLPVVVAVVVEGKARRTRLGGIYTKEADDRRWRRSSLMGTVQH